MSVLLHQFEPESDSRNVDDRADQSEPTVQAQLEQNVASFYFVALTFQTC